MGLYINENSKGETLNLDKADAILQDGGVEIDTPTEFTDDLVCVVDNGIFEAAAYAYSPAEMNEFALPDGRDKRWFKYPHAKTLAK